MAGEPLTLGTRVLRDSAEWRARGGHAVDACRIRDAGFVVVGRTNVPELCASGTTEPLAFGPTRNPWDHVCSPGGSSGGSAAAVASGMVAIAHGSDGGGSVREPASLCGVVGLMPSRGRISAAPAGAPWGGFSNDGVIARTVRDVAAGIDVMAGNEPGDPYLAPPLPGPLAEEVGRGPGACRIGLRLHGVGDADPTHPEVAAAVTALAGTWRSSAITSSPRGRAALDDANAAPQQGLFVAAEVASGRGDRPRPRARGQSNPVLLEVSTRPSRRAGGGDEHGPRRRRAQWLIAWARRLVPWWTVDGFDLLLTPIITQPPFPLGWCRRNARRRRWPGSAVTSGGCSARGT